MRRMCVLALLLAFPPAYAQVRTLSVDDLTALPTANQEVVTGTVMVGLPESHRLVVVYRDVAAAEDASEHAARTGTRLVREFREGGAAVFGAADSEAKARLAGMPGVQYVLEDRVVKAHAITLRAVKPAITAQGDPVSPPIAAPPKRFEGTADSMYSAPTGWAVKASGGYGRSIGGGTAAGPWVSGMAQGVRIAVLDSGVDRTHPDLAANLALNLSEVDQTALPSPCDDGLPQDQQGHGTYTASLAAAAIGGGELIGVAPQATILNIKVMERTPAVISGSLSAQCNAGEAAGLMSWVLAGIDDAVANHADILSLSLGSIVDLNTGDGAGWKAAFDRATHAAANAGVLVVAAVGNDGIDLSRNLIELPAQARDVVAVVAATNPDCAENAAANAICVAGPVMRASYSNFGAAGAVAAPGGNVPDRNASLISATGVSGFIRGACTAGNPGATDGASGSFACFDRGRASYIDAIGTSAAAALAAGTAALLKSSHPQWHGAELANALRAMAPASGKMMEPFATAVQ